MKKGYCEFCDKRLNNASLEYTVCRQCDESMEVEQSIQMAAKEAKHAQRFKCQKCGCGLELHRARYCADCVPTYTNEHGNAVTRRVDINEDFMYCELGGTGCVAETA